MKPLPKDIVVDVLDFMQRMKEENSNRSYSAIKNALHLFSISIPAIKIPSGTKVYRMRRHENNLMFTRIQDLGHRIDRNGILDFGRANEPLQSLFYCATSPNVAFCETSQLIRFEEKKKSEAHTIGIWRFQKDVVVANIPKFDNKSGNPTVGLLNEDFENYVSKNRNEDLLNLQYFLKNIGNEFATKWTPENNCYLITAAISNYIFEKKMVPRDSLSEVNIEGIIYPSVQWDAEGMNLAINSNLIEDGSIKLEQAIFRNMELKLPKTYIETAMSYTKAINYETYELTW